VTKVLLFEADICPMILAVKGHLGTGLLSVRHWLAFNKALVSAWKMLDWNRIDGVPAGG
jgi:hypothetical protein